MLRRVLVLGCLLLTACEMAPTGDMNRAQLERASFAELRGFEQDRLSEAFRMFVRTCQVNARRANSYVTRAGYAVGNPEGWRHVCGQAQRLHSPTDGEAKRFFESQFDVYRVTTAASDQGRMTGYYEPLLHGSRTKTARFHVPVYGVPRDFRKPYLTRAQIVAGQIKGRAPVLLYVDDPVMLFFLHIQGSGKVRLPDGHIVGLQYAAQNGHGYTAIGRYMKDKGYLETVSLQTIRDWLHQNPDKADEVMNTNPSYIFFTLSPGEEYAKGAIGIPLTPGRSLAIDDDQAIYGTPIFIRTTKTDPYSKRQVPLNRLMIAQDTGGAIIGGHRGDIFYGRGEAEEYEAGHQNHMADVYWLLPKASGSSLDFLTF